MDGVVDVERGAASKRSTAGVGGDARLTVSGDERKRILAEAARPGAVVSEVARRWGVSPQRVFGWRRQVHGNLVAAGGPADPVFVPIVPDGSRAVAEPAAAAASRSGARIEVRLAGADLRIASGTDATLLTMVLRAIRASAA
jgi:transposase